MPISVAFLIGIQNDIFLSSWVLFAVESHFIWIDDRHSTYILSRLSMDKMDHFV